MKGLKLSLISISLGFLFSCTNDNQIDSEMPNPVVSHVRSLDEVLAIAEKSLSILEEGTTRAVNPTCRTIDMQNIKVIGKEGTRSVAQGVGSSPLLYIVNFNDSLGYSIVSANRSTEGLIAITEKGSCDPDCIENPGLQYYMDCAKRYVAESQLPFILYTDTVTHVRSCGPLLDTEWGQQGTWGAYCPNGICGCGPLALFEVMSYHRYPDSVNLSYRGVNGYSLNLDWDDMMLHKSDRIMDNELPCCYGSASSHRAIGLLAREIGYRADASYENSGTYTYFSQLQNVAVQMGYTSNGINYYTPECTMSPINNHHPLLVRGQTSYGEGHAWVIDGYRMEILRIMDRGLEGVDHSGTIYRTEMHLYNHMNWGWNGNDNGYFTDGVFAPNNYYLLDHYYTNVDYNFSNQVKYMEIYPNQ